MSTALAEDPNAANLVPNQNQGVFNANNPNNILWDNPNAYDPSVNPTGGTSSGGNPNAIPSEPYVDPNIPQDAYGHQMLKRWGGSQFAKGGGLWGNQQPMIYPGGMATPDIVFPNVFQGGGIAPANAGETPWAETVGVWGRQAAGNMGAYADAALAGSSWLSSLGENRKNKLNQEQYEGRLMGDALFEVGDANRGSWTVNRGDFRPDQQNPVFDKGYNFGNIGSPIVQSQFGGQFGYQPMNNVQQNSQYRAGGEYYLNDNEINNILQAGGQIEFI